jgi:hypothetical protein
MLEDALFQPAQLRPRLQPELLGQMAPARMQRGQSVRLTARTVQRHHEVGHQALACGMVVCQALKFRDQFWSETDGQVRFGTPLQSGHAPFVQPVAHANGKWLRAQVGQGSAPPKTESLAERTRRGSGIFS